jgi:hypothetical protein
MDGSCPIGASADPLLGPLADNGGFSLTQLPLPGSPAIDGGTTAGCPSTDQRGLPRPAGLSCHIGAVEVQPFMCRGDCDGKGTVTVDELLTLVNIALGNAQPLACPDGVPSGAEVDITLILQAVNHALNGCGG